MWYNLRILAIVTAWLILYAPQALAQGPDTLWTGIYGGRKADTGNAVEVTTDGGYIVAGWTMSFGRGWRDVYLVKVDAHGDTLWTRAYGDTLDDSGYSVRQTSDGGYIVAGETWEMSPYGEEEPQIYLIRTDANGDTLWTRTYGEAGYDYGRSVQITDDGGFIVAGASGGDALLMKTDAEGNVAWSRSYGSPGPFSHENGESVVQTSDGGYAMTGETWSFSATRPDVFLTKTDSDGDTLWTRMYGTGGTDYGRSVLETDDHGFVVAGNTGGDILILKTDSSGALEWMKGYGGTDFDKGYEIEKTSDGGYIAVGNTSSFGSGQEDVYVVRVNSVGDTLWTRAYGGTGPDEGRSIRELADGGYIVAGYSLWRGWRIRDVYLLRLVFSDPRISEVADVALDQGRQVRLSWHRSALDKPGSESPVAGYSIWRRIAPLGPGQPDSSDQVDSGRELYPPGTWDYIETVPARCEDIYNCVVPTLCDSTAYGMCWSAFFVSAMTADPSVYFDSKPDSGYSVDNLAPLPPENLRFLSPTELAWAESQESDFDYFSVYGSSHEVFDNSASLVAKTSSIVCDVTDAISAYYHVTSTDFAGNEGEASTIPDAAGVSTYALLQNRPNPFGAKTAIRFHLPQQTHVTLSVFSVEGCLVKTLAQNTFPGGRHTVEWAGDDNTGESLSSGIYFIRMDAGDFRQTRKMMILR
ncbi:FlgD immunoglobulin-like domain containing protein [Candidatus Eisenbacteria bacterium]|uniref:FlgD immunoglobulin-like domain containing protein n=1 Tax=Eiseniibacteriota bacterium TaxID=2212470 RepID=A0ABV6YNR6_UNCEI